MVQGVNMSAAGILASAPSPIAGYSHGRKILIFGIMAFGQFMALLDTQIVAASLNSIQAGLSAGPDEIAWVQTAYLMAEIVMIPLAAFLSQAVAFTFASLMCGLAWSIVSMTLFPRNPGFCRRCDGADRVRDRLHAVHRQGAGYGAGDPGTGVDARTDAGADDRRMDHRYRELALALLHQHRTRDVHRDRVAVAGQGG